LHPDVDPSPIGVRSLITEIGGRTGDDDRRDIETVSDPRILQNADAVCAIIRREQIAFDSESDTWVVDKYKTLEEEHNICEGPFREQPVVAYGTGFLVKDDLIVTAGHTIEDFDLNPDLFVVVFDYKTNNGGVKPLFEASQVFRPTEIVECRKERDTDWALVRLDRSPGRTPVTLNYSSPPEVGDSLYLIGHGEGLPLKYSDGAAVTRWPHDRYFKASLDAFGYDSGAPVFNRKTHLVEGLVRLVTYHYVDRVTSARCVPDSHECCERYRFDADPDSFSSHSTIVPTSEIAYWVDPDNCDYVPPASGECTAASDAKPVTIVVNTDYAIINVDDALPRLVTPGPPTDLTFTSFERDVIYLLRCDAAGCEWEPCEVESGRIYSIEDDQPRSFVSEEKRWLNVKLVPKDHDR
jgi:hypothetical protein